jgi:hypothetical protein
MIDCWHIIVPLLLHSRHVRIERLLGVSQRLDAIARDAYPGLEPYRKLEFVCKMAERLINTRLIRLFYHLASLPTADDIGAVLLNSSSECYWTMLACLGEDGRLWRFMDRGEHVRIEASCPRNRNVQRCQPSKLVAGSP